MPALTIYAANQILSAGAEIPANLYIDLHISAPNVAGVGGVAVGNVRKLVTRSAPTNGEAPNDNIVSWVPYTESETATHASFWDASGAGAGNCWFIGEFDTPVPLVDGEAAFFDVGDIIFVLETYAP